MKRTIVTIFVGVACAFSTLSHRSAHAEEEASFLPTWKLLSTQEKQQFIAGYILAWRDSSRVTDIVIGYVRTNPEKAISSLESIRGIYDLSGTSPETLSRGIDEFYADPENRGAPLSRAISAAKNR